MISKEAKKAKDKFTRLGFLISALALNPTELSKFKVYTQRINFNFVVGKLIKKSKGSEFKKLKLGRLIHGKLQLQIQIPIKYYYIFTEEHMLLAIPNLIIL